MSSPFPLLRLLRLVLCDVFKLLNIGEKINLSICSKKIFTQFNIARFYSQKVIVVLGRLYQKIEVSSENKKDTFGIFVRFNTGISEDLDIQYCRIEGVTVPVTTEPTKITTFWRNYREGFLSVVQHLLQMFQCKISTDSSYYNIFQLQPTISELFGLQSQFKTLTIHLKRAKDQHLFWDQISNNFGLVEDLRIISVAHLCFRPVLTSWPQKISIRSSYWFTLESLLTCTCTKISLEDSLLGNKDLDKILKKWKTGGFPNLDRLKIHSARFKDNGEQILGMSLGDLDWKVIQIDDGSKKATLRIIGQSIEMSVTSLK